MPGEIPDLDTLSARKLDESLSSVRNAAQSMASVHYLQSRPMREDLMRSSFRGSPYFIVQTHRKNVPFGAYPVEKWPHYIKWGRSLVTACFGHT
jgi:hypothetical protein